jgi:peptidoglycan hydrolase-like protein with peptidoglycan-binding domain
MSKGAKGERVKWVQRIIGCAKADGNFGKLTDEALRKWQEAGGLTSDGVIGPKTFAQLTRENV